MTEIIAIWNFLQQLGQVSAIGVLVAVVIIWRNDLAHLAKDLKEVKAMLYDHLKWHASN